MKKVGGFELYLDETSLNDDGSRKQISVEVQVGTENTAVLLNCECCEELLSSRLPGGVLIPIASTLKSLFKSKGMRNIDVETTGTLMTRVYRGVIKKPFSLLHSPLFAVIDYHLGISRDVLPRP
ncbi:MAG: hypothetical protein ACXAEJ_16485 [Candidatus Thorarchaeota archaeon]|jgi:hypothetical protein